MLLLRSIVSLILICSLISCYEIHVSHHKGSDTNRGTRKSPFQTIHKAKEHVRKLKMVHTTRDPISIVLHSGKYVLDEPLQFTWEDSGTAFAPVTYKAKKGQKVKISSCHKIDAKWEKVSGKPFYSTVVKQTKEFNFTSLFVGGNRRPRARFDDVTYVKAGKNKRFQMVFKNMDIDVKWKNIYRDAMVVLFHSWTASRHYIEHVDNKTKTVTFAAPANWDIDSFAWDSGKRYYVENVYEALDEPGEWFFDTESRILYYYPLPVEKLGKKSFCYPTLESLVQLNGDIDANKMVEYIHFDRIRFEHTAWILGRKTMSDFQAAADLTTATVYGNGTSYCSFSKCQFKHTGGYALYLEYGSSHNSITHSKMRDLGAGGVRLGPLGLNTGIYTTSHNIVSSNKIVNTGRVFLQGVGILVHHSSDNHIHNNVLRNLYYTAISVGWVWGYKPSGAYNNRITANKIYNVGMEQLNDMGGIYTLGISVGTKITGNVIAGVHSRSAYDFGIYLDEGSSYILVENNTVSDTGSSPFFQHYGKMNLIHKNIFKKVTSKRECGTLKLPDYEDHISFLFVNNYVEHNQPKLVCGPEKATWTHFMYDQNEYVNMGDGPMILLDSNITFSEWQKTYLQDLHSHITRK